MTLDFVLSLILYRFLLKFLLLFCKLVRGVLPTATVVAWETPCTSPSIIFLSFVSNFQLCSELSPAVLLSKRKGLGVDFPFRLTFVCVLLLATDSFTVSGFESFQSSSRSSMLFSPAVGFALVYLLLAVLLSCLLLAVLLSCLLLAMLLSCLFDFHLMLGRVAFFLLLTTGSLAVVLSLLPPASLCGKLTTPWFASGLLQHHSALSHSVTVVSR